MNTKRISLMDVRHQPQGRWWGKGSYPAKRIISVPLVTSQHT